MGGEKRQERIGDSLQEVAYAQEAQVYFLILPQNKYRSPIIAAEVRRPAKALQKLKLGRITNLLAQWLHRLRVGSGLKSVNDQQINQPKESCPRY